MQHYSTLGLDRGASSKEVKKVKGRTAVAACRLLPPLVSAAHPAQSPPTPRRPTDCWPSSCTPTRAATRPPLRGCSMHLRC